MKLHMNMVKNLMRSALSLAVILVLTLSGAGTALGVNAGGAQHLDFSNTVKIGANATVGFTTRYSNVITGVDAILTVIDKNNSTVNNVDRVSTVDNWQIWTNENLGTGGGYVKYRVDFVVSGSNRPTTLENLAINVGDIDARQYVQFAGPTSYTLGSGTQLVVQTHSSPTPNNPNIPAGSIRFAETAGAGSTDTDTRYWAQVNYASISSVDIQLGATVGGAALFQVAFGSAAWNGAEVAPVTPPAATYTVTYNKGDTTATVTGLPNPTSGTGAQTIVSSTLTNNQSQTFLYWNTRSDGTGVTYTAGDTIVPSTDVTLYAVWSTPVTVTYNGNGASGGTTPSSTTGSGAVTVSSPGNLTKPGFDFVGWNTAANGAGLPYEPGDVFVPEANTTLYAMWAAQPLVTPNNPVNIDSGAGTPLSGADVNYVIPGLDPGTQWNLVVDPAGEPPVEIDAGYVPDSGSVSGITQMPSTVVPGENTIVFTGIDPDGNTVTISTVVVISNTGTFVSQAASVRVTHILAKTGGNTSLALLAGSLLLLSGVSLLAIRRRTRN